MILYSSLRPQKLYVRLYRMWPAEIKVPIADDVQQQIQYSSFEIYDERDDWRASSVKLSTIMRGVMTCRLGATIASLIFLNNTLPTRVLCTDDESDARKAMSWSYAWPESKYIISPGSLFYLLWLLLFAYHLKSMAAKTAAFDLLSMMSLPFRVSVLIFIERHYMTGIIGIIYFQNINECGTSLKECRRLAFLEHLKRRGIIFWELMRPLRRLPLRECRAVKSSRRFAAIGEAYISFVKTFMS